MLLTYDYPIELFETISSKRLKFLIANASWERKNLTTYILIQHI